ncbi:hypothetical protein J2W14_002648 [Pseudarthrobacter oxydans]|uniref:hypothetical protein n=1 Tax=Pseudarthrobacter oxydans TaxID=1671 RepID=UPI00277EAC66|nr:hypothetical protein [Pseudarthrobacter oxydans]MDP9983235.1 hypothetical protein [Pseudarthrobacter oxydans]
MKRSLSRAASAVGAAIILSTAGFAGPAQATEACWSGPGSTCRDYRESAAGLAKVRAAEQPTFTGILKAGQTLTSSPGVWLYGEGSGTNTLKYQWLRDGVGIPGAVGETYRITKSDTDHSLALRVSASAPGVNDGVETTLPSPKVSNTNTAEYTARPGITGEVPTVGGWTRVGSTLEVHSLGTWSPGWMILKLQWQADGVDIEGAIADTYTIKAADLGKVVTLKATGSSAGVPSVSMSNTSTAVTPGFIEPTDEMWLSGGDKVGSTLSVERSQGWYAGGELVTLLYQWERDGQAIAGATASTYTVVAADSGHWVRARVTATAPGYNPNAQTTLYNDIVDGDSGGNEGVEPGGEPAPAPVPVPVPEPAPEPAPVPAPADPAPPEPAPADEAPALQAPAPQSPTVQPLARTSPAQKYVPAETVGDVQPQAAGPVQAAVTGAVEPADIAVAPTESAPAAPAPADTAGPSPSPSSPSGQAAAATQATANPFNPLPVFFTIAGVLIAAGLVWVIRPLRASVLRIAGRKAS